MPTDCLPVTGAGFNYPALLVGVLLLLGGIGVVLVFRRRGRMAAGAAALAILLLGAVVGIGASAQPASAACPPPVVTAASIGSFVWVDTNGNGIQDSGEPGVAGIQLTLLSATTSDPVTTGFDGAAINPVTTTDANGHYSFTNLAPGSYIVKLDITDPVPVDVVNMTLPFNNATAITYEVLSSGGDVLLRLAISAHSGTTGFVGGFFGSGHTVKAFDGATDVTSTLLNFSSSVTPTPAAPTLTQESQGTNPALDSDFNSATGLTGTVTLTSGENDPDIDGGLLEGQGVSGIPIG